VKISGPLISKVDHQLMAQLLPIAVRLAKKDTTIWGANSEAPTRLNWVELPLTSRDLLPQLDSLSAWARSNKLNEVILCGMGGSSLAAEVIAKTYKKPLVVLDSTHPQQILNSLPKHPANSVIVISSKSGTTVETISQLKFFINYLADQGLKPENHLVIVTDPDTPLDKLAKNSGYKVVTSDPFVGGRFSALTAFGLVPAALLGIDSSLLLDDAEIVAKTFPSEASPVIVLASLLFSQTKQIFNICYSKSSVPGISDWIEQLIAESTGKNGTGRLPILIDSTNQVNQGVSLRLSQGGFDLTIEASLGEHFIFWEWVTALLCYLLKVDPFDQPNVLEAKERSADILNLIISGDFKAEAPVIEATDYLVYSNRSIKNLAEFFTTPAEYFAILAYLPRTNEYDILKLTQTLSDKLNKPISFGWGPRYLHSTGQFHKGGQPNGCFIQITDDARSELTVPGESTKFSDLIKAQALGDAAAIGERRLPLMRIQLKHNNSNLEKILKEISCLLLSS
jgi:glucose-6-phosphate isomerase